MTTTNKVTTTHSLKRICTAMQFYMFYKNDERMYCCTEHTSNRTLDENDVHTHAFCLFTSTHYMVFTLFLCISGRRCLFRCFNTLDAHHHRAYRFSFIVSHLFALLSAATWQTWNAKLCSRLWDSCVHISFYFVCQYYFVRLKLNRYDASVHFACLLLSLCTHAHWYTLMH